MHLLCVLELLHLFPELVYLISCLRLLDQYPFLELFLLIYSLPCLLDLPLTMLFFNEQGLLCFAMYAREKATEQGVLTKCLAFALFHKQHLFALCLLCSSDCQRFNHLLKDIFFLMELVLLSLLLILNYSQSCCDMYQSLLFLLFEDYSFLLERFV